MIFIRIRKAKIPARVTLMLCLLIVLLALLAIPKRVGGDFDEALQAVINFENEALEEIVANRPELLLEESANGQTLVDIAFLYHNDDHTPYTNYNFIEFLIKNDFFDQPIDRTGHFSMAISSLHSVDTHLRRPGLTEDMIFHKTRLPLLGLLSEVVQARLLHGELSSEESLELLMAICDPIAVNGAEGSRVSSSVSTALKESLEGKYAEYAAVYLSTGTLDKSCFEALMG